MKPEQKTVSVEEFVQGLLQQIPEGHDNDEGMTYGYEVGWLEEEDVMAREVPLVRKQAARIAHEFLRREQKEEDTDDVSSAGVLQDLYDCRICVRHVMQVYAKGIMDGFTNLQGRYVFGMEEYVSEPEMEQILKRLFHAHLRIKRTISTQKTICAKELAFEEAVEMLQANRDWILVDVRSETAFAEGHMDKAISIPLFSILKNPYMVNERRDIGVFLYCEEGYQSTMAANCLAEAGYEKVFYFAWRENR